MFIPMPKKSEKSSEVSPDNEPSAWDKMTLELKKHYQEYIFDCQRNYFEAIKITRG